MSKAALLTALIAALVAALHIRITRYPTSRYLRCKLRCTTGGGDFLCVVLCVALRNNALSICALIVLSFVLFVVLLFVLLGAQ